MVAIGSSFNFLVIDSTGNLFAGESNTRHYDEMANLISVTKPMGNYRIMSHDPFNRLTTVVDYPTGPAVREPTASN